jgi:hypothetical protein
MRAGSVFSLKQSQALIPSCLLAVLILSVPVLVQAQLDDPTRPPGYRLVLPGGKKAGKTSSHFSLSSVYISSTRRVAVINDHRVESGEFINGAKVLAIQPAAVILQKQGRTFTVRLLSQAVKKTRVQ